MKVLICSDTHGSLENFKRVIEKERPDRVLHLGDSHDKIERIQAICQVPLDIVKGNCDGGMAVVNGVMTTVQNEMVTTVMGQRVFMTHGHYYGVNSDISRITYRAEELGCDIALYGHTHIPDVSYLGKVKVICPGSLTEPRQQRRIPTYAIMENTEDEKIDIKIVELS